MDLRQAFADLQAQIPSHGRADDARSEVVVAVRGIAEHDGKVLGYVVEKRNQRRSAFEIGRCLEDPVLEDRLVGGESEVLWISGTEELQHHFHQLFAGKFRPWKVLQDVSAVAGVEVLSLGNALFVGIFEFDPEVWLHLHQC